MGKRDGTEPEAFDRPVRPARVRVQVAPSSDSRGGCSRDTRGELQASRPLITPSDPVGLADTVAACARRGEESGSLLDGKLP